jgi:hypothetical protein
MRPTMPTAAVEGTVFTVVPVRRSAGPSAEYAAVLARNGRRPAWTIHTSLTEAARRLRGL